VSGRRFQFTVDHMIGRREVELVVTYSMTPGRAEQGPTYACGGQPAEPAEVEIASVKHEGREVTLSPDEEHTLWEQACERAEQDWANEQAAEADWRYQERRDRLLMEQWEGGEA